MLIKFDNLLQKIANWKTVLALFISFPIGYYIDGPIFYMIPRYDYYYSYTPRNIYDAIAYFWSLNLLKEYLNYQLTYQVFFPLVWALFFVTFIYNAGNGLVFKKILIPFALIIPFVTLLIDYLENAGWIIILRSFYLMPYSSFLEKFRNIAEFTSHFAPIKGFLWDMEFVIFFVGIAIYIFKITRFFPNKTGSLKEFKKNLFYVFSLSSTGSSNNYEKDFENKGKEQTNEIQIKAQELPKEDTRNNILALLGVIGLISILVFIVIFLRSISPYPIY